MVRDTGSQASMVADAVAKAVAADAWDKVRSELLRRRSQLAAPSARAQEFRIEVNTIATALRSGASALDARFRRYLVETCQRRWETLLAVESEFHREFDVILDAVEATIGQTATGWGAAVRWRFEQSPDGPRIGIGVMPSSPQVREELTVSGRPPISGTHMEFAGERLGLYHPWRLRHPEAIVWQRAALRRLVEPPLDLLPTHVYGRRNLLDYLISQLSQPDGRIHEISGEPGVGKSTVALALARRASEENIQVWWVRGSAELIDASMTAIATLLDADPADVAEATAGRRNLADLAWEQLEKSRRPWLLVIDDVDDPARLHRIFMQLPDPNGWVRTSRHGMVVVTSRGTGGRRSRHVIAHSVSPFDPDTSREFLCSVTAKSGSDRGAEHLAELLRGFPLGLSLAAKHYKSRINEIPTLESYAAILSRLSADHLPAVPDPSHPASDLLHYFRYLIRSVQGSDTPEAWPLLAVMSYCSSGTPLPVHLLDFSSLAKFGLFQSGEHVTLNRVFALLDDLGLAEVVDWGAAREREAASISRIYIHPLVSYACRSLVQLPDSSVIPEDVLLGAASLLMNATQEQLRRTEINWAELAQLGPHVASLLLNLPEGSPSRAVGDAITAARATMRYLAGTGALQSAEQLGRRALKLSVHLAEEDDVSLELRYDLARILLELGRISESRNYLQSVLDVRQRTIGLDHDKSLDVMEQLALVIQREGSLGEAERLLLQVARGRERSHTAGAAERVRAFLSLAQVLNRQGKLGEMERIARYLLRMLTDSYGPDSQESLEAEANLASSLRSQGELDEAERILERVLARQQTLLGRDHVTTLATWAELAETYRELGKLESAERENRLILASRRNHLGDDHPDTISAFIELAETYRDMGQLENAEELLVAAYGARRRILGPEHPETMNAALGLAVICRDLGRLPEAEDLLRGLMASCEATAGLDDQIALSVQHNLGAVLQESGQIEEALSIYRSLYDRREWKFGPNHPETLRTMVNLGSLLQELGSLEEAEHLYRQAYVTCSDLFGDEHPYTLTAQNNIANILLESGRAREAKDIYESVFEAQIRTLGAGHPDTLITKINLSIALTGLGRSAEAETLLAEAIDSYVALVGPGHPLVLSAKSHLADIHARAGNLEEARRTYDEVLELQEHHRGRSQSDMVVARFEMARLLERLGRSDESESQYQRAIGEAVRSSAVHG